MPKQHQFPTLLLTLKLKLRAITDSPLKRRLLNQSCFVRRIDRQQLLQLTQSLLITLLRLERKRPVQVVFHCLGPLDLHVLTNLLRHLLRLGPRIFLPGEDIHVMRFSYLIPQNCQTR